MTTETAIRTLMVVWALYVAALFLGDLVTDIWNVRRANHRRGHAPNKLS